MKSFEEASQEIAQSPEYKWFSSQVHSALISLENLRTMDVNDFCRQAFALTIRKMQEDGEWPEDRPVIPQEIDKNAETIWEKFKHTRYIPSVVSDYYRALHWGDGDGSEDASWPLDWTEDIATVFHELFND